MEPKEKKAFEPSGLVPRSIVRTFERFRQQLLPGSETAAIREYRISRYQVLVSARCLFTLLIIPIATNWFVSSWLLSPLVEHFWNTQQNEIFLNSYQEERAFAELESFSEKLFFESLLNTTNTINVNFTPYAQNSSATNSRFAMFNYPFTPYVLYPCTPSGYGVCKEGACAAEGYGTDIDILRNQICTTRVNSYAIPSVTRVNLDLPALQAQYNNYSTTQAQRNLLYKSGTTAKRFVKTCNINGFAIDNGSAIPSKVKEHLSLGAKQSQRTSEAIDFTSIFSAPLLCSAPKDYFVYPRFANLYNMVKQAEYSQNNEGLLPHTLIPLRGMGYVKQRRGMAQPLEKQRGPEQKARQSLASNSSILLPQKGGFRESFAEVNRSALNGSLRSPFLEITYDNSVKIKEKVQNKILELAIYYNQQTIISITNIVGDVVSLVTLGCLFIWMKPEITILKSFLIEAIYSLSDTTKSFLLILLTDLLVGFHSPRGWETALELLLKHFGLPENQDFVFLFVATFPVLLDTVFKYWIFRHLNKISPSTVATYHSMIE